MTKTENKRNTGGWAGKLTPEDRKTKVYGYVKTKFYLQAQKEVNELLKKYR